jgi:protein SCO1/2
LKRAFQLVVACIAIASPVVANAGDAAHTPLPADSVYQVDATLSRAGGGETAWRALRGTPRVVTMFYSTCRAVCPMIVESARAVQRGVPAADRSRVGFVLLTMDPSRDTPPALAAVQRERHLDPATWLLLRPDEADVRTLAAILGVRYRALADGEFNHTTTLVLLDADGRVLARTEKIGSARDPEFIEAVRTAAAMAR